MSTLREVKEAEKKMEQARKALFAYMELPPQKEIDVKLWANLAEKLQSATDEYVTLIGELVPGSA
jgi:hypothetical protein